MSKLYLSCLNKNKYVFYMTELFSPFISFLKFSRIYVIQNSTKNINVKIGIKFSTY